MSILIWTGGSQGRVGARGKGIHFLRARGASAEAKVKIIQEERLFRRHLSNPGDRKREANARTRKTSLAQWGLRRMEDEKELSSGVRVC